MIEKGSWVRIHKIILEPSQRAPQVPDDTKQVPLEMWVKGYLQKEAEIGDTVEILTLTGRKETGTLIELNPYYNHSFGKFVPELLVIGKQVRDIVLGGEGNE